MSTFEIPHSCPSLSHVSRLLARVEMLVEGRVHEQEIRDVVGEARATLTEVRKINEALRAAVGVRAASTTCTPVERRYLDARMAWLARPVDLDDVEVARLSAEYDAAAVEWEAARAPQS